MTPWTVARQAPVHGIFQASVLERVAIYFSRGLSQPRDRTHVSCIAGILYRSAIGKVPSATYMLAVLFQRVGIRLSEDASRTWR